MNSKTETTDDYWVGLDIGGANIKIADTSGRCQSLTFPMWTDFKTLPKTLSKLVRDFSLNDSPQVVATMTGELADCFASKKEGVAFICDALAKATYDCLVYRIANDGDELVGTNQAKQSWQSVAAANWHALTSFVARSMSERSCGILFDIGSTTTDIIPFADKRCVSKSGMDIDRIQAGELVYTGIVRSPVCALIQEFDFEDKCYSIAQELFATALDAYLVLGKIPESQTSRFTADGRPATIVCAKQRLARCLCADATEISDALIARIAQRVADQQFELIAKHFHRVYENFQRDDNEPPTIVVSGQGSWLARETANTIPNLNVTSLDEMFQDKISEAAPAFAVAKLAQMFAHRSHISGAADARC